LIKHYELEVHYHPGNVDVVEDALSHKAHCNYLSVVCLTREESNTQVLPDLSVYNITLTSILRDEIIATQKNGEGMAPIKRRIQECDPMVNYFREVDEGTLWFNDRLVVPVAPSGVTVAVIGHLQ
jgi:hypothetical protein